MKLIAQVKLLTTPEQYDALRSTLEQCNTACDWIAGVAWDSNTLTQFKLHKIVYTETREQFGLSSQMAVRAIGKVADAYKAGKRRRRTFHPRGAFPYDARILTWKLDADEVSILTLDGREKIPFVCGERARNLLEGQRGETDLVCRDGSFYLFATCEVEVPEPPDFDDALGVDMGIVNIAVDSDGEIHKPLGAHLNCVRAKYRRLRAKLQAKGTRPARRRLRAMSGKESRFAKDVNHCISKRIVAKAKDTGRAVAVEDLTGIRDRVTVRKPQRATHSSWSFHQLRAFLTYKAALAGVPLVAVDPHNTSRECPVCGCIDKRNRKDQAIFSCVSCSFAGLADHIAAGNIARRAVVSRPNVPSSASRLSVGAAA